MKVRQLRRVLNKGERHGREKGKVRENQGKKGQGKKVKEKKNSLDVKKLKNYFNKNTFLGITLVGMVVLVLVYVFVFLDYQEKTTEVQAANDELAKSLKELEEYFNNMEKYQTEISEYKMAVSDIMSEYPADAREEDIIMLAVQMQEKMRLRMKASAWMRASRCIIYRQMRLQQRTLKVFRMNSYL